MTRTYIKILTSISSFNILLNTVSILVFAFKFQMAYQLFIMDIIIFILTTCIIPCVFYNFSLTLLSNIALIILMVFSVEYIINNETDELIIVWNYIYICNNILLVITEYIMKHTIYFMNIYNNFSNNQNLRRYISNIHNNEIVPVTSHYIVNLPRVNDTEYKNICSICLDAVDYCSSRTYCNHYFQIGRAHV